jgi:serine phosphatase RsbU (regulator of sigma subunit)
MPLIHIAVAKTHKYGSRDSGDTAEIAERPTGGLSVILVDGQGSGAAAKTLSMLVSSKAVALLKEGVRDGAVARSVHDFLHAYRHGKVSASLDLASVDLASSSVVVTRNSTVPYLVCINGEVRRQDLTAGPIGVYRHSRPVVDHYPLEAGLQVILFTDGIVGAGRRRDMPFEPLEYIREHARASSSVTDIADGLLMAAISADGGRPADDMTVAVLSVGSDSAEREPIRRMFVSFPAVG